MIQKILFIRDFKQFQGGHLKYFHYIQHVKNYSNYCIDLYLTPESLPSNEIEWNRVANIITTPKWEDYSVVFVAGIDWKLVPTNLSPSTIIINLIQGISHSNVNDIKYQYLGRKAIRICVSHEVQKAILETKQVVGQVFTIPAAIDIVNINVNPNKKNHSVIIDGIKNKGLAIQIKNYLSKLGINSIVIKNRLPRKNYLSIIQSAHYVLFLPCRAEGFYLPALEAMAMGKIVICPDVFGNREYCIDGLNCFNPTYDYTSIKKSLETALVINASSAIEMKLAAIDTSSRFSLATEGQMFHSYILSKINYLWRRK